MAYVDGIVSPVLAGREEEYRALSRRMAALFTEYGAIQVAEALDDDVPHGQRTDLWRAVAAVEGERLAFSWVMWPDKAARDAGWAKVTADERMRGPTDDLPLDGRRMIFGGFEMFLDTARS